MDISVIIPSRKRTRGLSAIITSMHLLESGKNKVTYGVACDADDNQTITLCEQLKKEIPLAHYIGPGRPSSLGGLVNYMASHMPADVYTAVGDDNICLTPYWDEVIAQAVKAVPHGVFWWKNAFPEEATYAIVTEKWRAAADRKIFTDSYPFWFDDLCLLETWMMATGQEAMVLDCTIADKPYHTYRMRDLWFWREFFTETRGLRIKQSHKIAERLGLPDPDFATAFAEKMTIALEKMPKERIEQIERNQGETNIPPDHNYVMTRARAERILSELHKEEKNAA